MIYFDNAATGGFKPNSVTQAVNSVINFLSANPGRSGHRLAVTGAKIVSDCRTMLSETFNCSTDRVIFTKNCTEALNILLFGTLKKYGHVITTVYEHNSVLRPLLRLEKQGLIDLTIVSSLDEKGLISEIKKSIRKESYLIVCTCASNVTGFILPIKEIGKIAKEHRLLYFIDGAQGAGHFPIDMKELSASAIALAGHKGLYGIMGSGALLLSDDLEIEPLLFGGTGTETFNPDMPISFPERLEAGTVNLPAIASLLEGVRYVKNNLSTFSEILYSYTSRLYSSLSQIDGIKIYSKPNKVGIFSFEVLDKPSNLVSDLLNSEYDVAVRGGWHCAPLIHNALNTNQEGLVRVSLAPQNTIREIDYLKKSLLNIIKG